MRAGGRRTLGLVTAEPAGELIGRGRDCDVFAAGPGRVLRRNRNGDSTEREARTMRHVAAHGFPVPEVFDADGPDIVMERLEGPTMLDDLARRPWRVRSHCESLADLIDRLGRVPLPDHELARHADGDTLAHLDLHPDNVQLTSHGPVVIDWTNASAGGAGLDAANTWLTIAVGRPDASWTARAMAAIGRRLVVREFLRATDVELACTQLAAALAFRRRDPNLTEMEVALMQAIVDAQPAR